MPILNTFVRLPGMVWPPVWSVIGSPSRSGRDNHFGDPRRHWRIGDTFATPGSMACRRFSCCNLIVLTGLTLGFLYTRLAHTARRFSANASIASEFRKCSKLRCTTHIRLDLVRTATHKSLLRVCSKNISCSMKLIIAYHHLLRDKIAQSHFIYLQNSRRIAIPVPQQAIPQQDRLWKQRKTPVSHAKRARAGEVHSNKIAR